MKLIKDFFDEYFSNWEIKFPHENLNERLSGYINHHGWLIQYCFGVENGIEYMDFYACHRMTADRHIRIYENGEMIDLPAYRMYDDKEYNSNVTKLLIENGFDRFTINMELYAGISKNMKNI